MAGDVATIANPSILSNPGQMQQWSNLIESLFGSEETRTTNTQSGSAADPIIMQMLQQLMGTSGQGANAANIQALIAPIMMQLRDQALPAIQQGANAGGGVFNSSTQKLLQNDALARATALGGEAVVKQQNNQQTQIMNLLNILAQATKSTQQQQNASKPGTASNLGKAALGAAAASKLAKAFQNAKNAKNSESPSAAGGTGQDDEAMARMAIGSQEERGESVSGQWGEDKGMEFDSWDSGNSPMDSIWDAFGDVNAPDFEGNWDDTGESVSGFWGGADGSGETGESVSGFWGDSGGGSGGDEEFVDYGEYF